MSHHASDTAHPSSPEHDSHHEAHVLSLRLILGSILAPKRPSPSVQGSHPVSGTASPFHHWHHPGPGTGHDSPPPPPHSTPVLPHHQPHYQPSYQHVHQPIPSPQYHHYHNHHGHAHHQPQPHAHAYGPSRLSFTHSTSSTPSESLSPSPTPSPRLATPPLIPDHVPLAHAFGHHPPVSDSQVTKTGTATGPDSPDSKRTHFITTLQSKSAWDALIHGSWV